MPFVTMKIVLSNHLVLKFNYKADIHEEWSKEKEKLLQNLEFRNSSLNEVKEMAKKHKIFALDLASHHTRVKQIAVIAEELSSLGYYDSNSIKLRSQRVCDQWDRLLILAHQRSISIKESEQLLEKIDALHLEFAKRVVPFNNWLDGAIHDLMDVFIVRIIKEIQDLVDASQQFKMKFLEADKQHFSILSLSQEIDSIATQYQIPGAKTNPYTALTTRVISDKWSEVKQLLPKRDQSLQRQHLMEQISENLCRLFAAKANIVGPWIDRQIYSVVGIAIEGNETLEEQLSKLSQHQMAVKLYRPHMDELETIHREIVKDLMAKDNKYSHYTMETLTNGWQQLISLINININEVENQIGIRDSKGITTEQLNRFRISFNQFDENRTGKLSEDKFKACLLSLGYNYNGSRAKIGCQFQRLMDEVDPNKTGCVAFDTFLNFVTKENTENESLKQIIDSFRILSSNKPYITAEDLNQRLSPDEALYCIKRMRSYQGWDAVTGALDYMSFSKELNEKDFKRNVH